VFETLVLVIVREHTQGSERKSTIRVDLVLPAAHKVPVVDCLDCSALQRGSRLWCSTARGVVLQTSRGGAGLVFNTKIRNGSKQDDIKGISRYLSSQCDAPGRAFD